MTIKQENNFENTPYRLRIVAIGASAGGLDAIEQFFSKIPEDSRMAFIIIQHLDPSHIGIMPELVQRNTAMMVVQAEENMKVEVNCVYIIPSNKSMTIKDGILHLSDPTVSRGLRLPIDIFFASLANDQKALSIGIILSGLGSDGSEGVRVIKEQHGIIMVQDPDTAGFDSMPLMAIDTGVVDIIAPANELYEKLIKFLTTTPILKPVCKLDETDNTFIEEIVIMLRKRTGNDFSLYKRSTILRRIERRMGIHKIEDIAVYVRYMQNNPNEIDIFFKELVIGVTSFFRDQMVWDKLKETVIPKLLLTIPEGSIIRVWVAGCSTGEEAYTLAIVFKEIFEKHNQYKNYNLQIFATDIDYDAVQMARKGLFSSIITDSVSPTRLEKYFTKINDEYEIKSEIREMIVFAQHNLIMHPPFTNINLVSCRNLLIYIDAEAQNNVIRLFNYSIITGGVLLLGSAETIGAKNEFYSPIDSKLKIFKRTSTTQKRGILNLSSAVNTNRNYNIKDEIISKPDINIESLANQFILDNYSLAGLLVNENGDIIYLRGATLKYLHPPVGKSNMNIFPLLRSGLIDIFPSAFNNVITNKSKLVLQNVKIDNELINITILWVDKPEILSGTIMITFSESQNAFKTNLVALMRKRHLKSLQKYDTDFIKNDSILSQTPNNALQNIRIIKQQKPLDNDHLRSINEVLQATNEELTTSREEMQSLNEELQTVNAELQIKADNYTKVSNDMKNLLNSTDIRILILDNKMNIRRFTDQTTNIFKIIKTDVGRPLFDLVSMLIYPEFATDAQNVLDSLLSFEKQVLTNDGKWYIVKIMPYLTLDNKIDGLVITFIEITDLKLSELELSETQQIVDILYNIGSDALIIISPDFKIISFSSNAEILLGKTKEAAIGQNFINMFIAKSKHAQTEKVFSGLLEDNKGKNIKSDLIIAEGKHEITNCYIERIYNNDKMVKGIIIIIKNQKNG